MLDTIISEGKPHKLEAETYEVDSIVKKLSASIIWQDKAKMELAMALSDSLHQIVRKDSPIAVLFFVWPTGVGKSEAVKALANILLGDRDKVVKINGEQFAESHTVGRLFGSPPSYVGYGDPSILEEIAVHQKEAMASKTASHLVKRLWGLNILLIDEIEKMHPKVQQSLLAVFDDGQCKLAGGKVIDLTSTLVICTSNIGEREKREERERKSIGFITDKQPSQNITKDAMKMFSPELQGRIDSVVNFEELTKVDATAIIDKLTREVNDTLTSHTEHEFTLFQLALTYKAKEMILSKGFSIEKGARELQRTFKRMVDAPLGRVLSLYSDMHNFPQYKVMIIGDVVDGKIEFFIDPSNIEEIKIDVKKSIILVLQHKGSPKI